MEAAAKEVASFEKNGTWVKVDFDKAKTKVLPGTWVFKRKCSPDGEITKYKAAIVFAETSRKANQKRSHLSLLGVLSVSFWSYR